MYTEQDNCFTDESSNDRSAQPFDEEVKCAQRLLFGESSVKQEGNTKLGFALLTCPVFDILLMNWVTFLYTFAWKDG